MEQSPETHDLCKGENAENIEREIFHKICARRFSFPFPLSRGPSVFRLSCACLFPCFRMIQVFPFFASRPLDFAIVGRYSNPLIVILMIPQGFDFKEKKNDAFVRNRGSGLLPGSCQKEFQNFNLQRSEFKQW